jgi:hypothetical protein
MPRVTLSSSALKALGCSPAYVDEPALTAEARLALQSLLDAFGFDRDRVIRVVKLATGEFVLAQ